MFDKWLPAQPEERGRQANATAIASVLATETQVEFPDSGTTGTLGTYDAVNKLWLFPHGVYRAYTELHFEHIGYPELFEKVTVTLTVGNKPVVRETQLNATNPGRTIVHVEQFFTIPDIGADVPLKCVIQADVAGRVQLLASSESYVVKMWEIGEAPIGL